MIKEKVKRNPIKFFILLLIGIFVFLSISFITTLVISYNPTTEIVSSFFNKTNVSTTLNFFISAQENNSTSQGNISTKIPANNAFNDAFSFDSISSIIALLGLFGIFSYLFYSIKDGTLSKTEDKKLFYSFLGGLGIIILFIAIVIGSYLQGKILIEKQFEIVGLIIFLFFTLSIAILFKIINDEIEENFKNRSEIIDFLEIRSKNAVICQPIDNFARFIVLISDFFSTIVFVLICVIPVFGVLIGLNLLSIIFFEIMIFTVFSGFCRLIRLCEGNSNITLNHHLYSAYSCSSEDLSTIFFLISNDDSYFKLLTKKGSITILKNEVITIHDNDVIIFRGKENLSQLNIWIKRTVRLVLSSIIAYLFFLLLFYYTVYIAVFIHPELQQISPPTMSLFLVTIQGLSLGFVFLVVGLFREGFDKWLELQVDRIIVPQSFEFY
jgi:hypothetical protein